MSAKRAAPGKGAITATIGVPGWTRNLSNLRAQVICARAQVQALRADEGSDALDAVARVLCGVKNQFEDFASELESMGERQS